MVLEINQIDFHGYRTLYYRTFQPNASTLDFSTIKPSTPDPYGIEKWSWNGLGFEKSEVEISCYQK